MRKLEGFIQYALLVFLFLLPIFFPPVFADLFDLPKIILFFTGTTLLTIFTLFTLLKKKKILLPPKSFGQRLAIFFLIYVLSTLLSIHRPTSLLGVWHFKFSTYTGGLIHLTAIYLLFLAILQIRQTPQFQKNILLYLTASAVLVSGFGLYQYLTHFFVDQRNFRIRSTIGEPNRLALFLVAALPLAFVLFLKQKRAISKSLAFLAFNLILLAVILTFSRTGWIVISLTGIIALLGNLQKLAGFLKKNKNYLLAGFLIYLTVILTSLPVKLFLKEIFLTRITYVQADINQKKGSTYLRLLEWEGSRQMFLDQPFFRQLIGNGPETIKFLYPQYRSPEIDQFTPEKYWQTLIIRNQYLHYLNTIGLLGLLTFLSLIAWNLKNFYQARKKTFFEQGIFYSWLAIVISSFFYYQTITTHTLFWTFLGLSISKERKLVLTRKIK